MDVIKKFITIDKLKELLEDRFCEAIETVDTPGLQTFTGTNDNLNSDVKKMTLQVLTKSGTTKTLHLVVKKNLDSSFHNFFTKLFQAFCREVLWYEYAQPGLAAHFAVIEDISPPCVFGYSVYQHSLRPSLSERMFGTLAGRLFRKADKGLLLLENVAVRDESCYKTIDKNAILDVEHAKVALKTLANYHGVWWLYINGHANDVEMKSASGHVIPREEFLSYLIERSKVNKILLKFLKDNSKVLDTIAKNNLPEKEADEMIAKLHRYFGEQMTKDADTVLVAKSKLDSMVHGDFWSNNMLFRQPDHDKVMFLDFQNLMGGHPSRDFWYFLYISTDRQWRTDHLTECMELYHQTLMERIGQHVSVTFDELRQEFEERRVFLGAFLGCFCVMGNVLSPYPYEFEGFSSFKQMKLKRERELSSPNKEDDHPMIKEIRRRMLETLLELSDLNLI